MEGVVVYYHVYITDIDYCVKWNGDTPDLCKHGLCAPILWGVNWIIPSGTWQTDKRTYTHSNQKYVILKINIFLFSWRRCVFWALLTRTLIFWLQSQFIFKLCRRNTPKKNKVKNLDEFMLRMVSELGNGGVDTSLPAGVALSSQLSICLTQ